MSYSVESLISLAKAAKEKAHCIYSKFPVGAALITTSGEVFTGCNVENASYPVTVCAERTAICKAVSEGYKEFVAIAVITNKAQKTTPCGMCRQALREFSKDLIVYCASSDGSYDTHRLSELLPYSFGPEDLQSYQS